MEFNQVFSPQNGLMVVQQPSPPTLSAALSPSWAVPQQIPSPLATGPLSSPLSPTTHRNNNRTQRSAIGAKTPERSPSRKVKKEQELDAHRLQQREKQIAYGENTNGYKNLERIMRVDPSLLKACVPVKPSIHQKCSKRSWDGQIRKWRRALHMYDYVDFGDSEEQSKAVRKALIEQSKNPIFHEDSDEDQGSNDGDGDGDGDGCEGTPPQQRGRDLESVGSSQGLSSLDDTPKSERMTPESTTRLSNRSTPNSVQTTPLAPARSPTAAAQRNLLRTPKGKTSGDLLFPTSPIEGRVRYNKDEMMQLLGVPQSVRRIYLPETLSFLDKRVDLEDLDEEEYPTTPLRVSKIASPVFSTPAKTPVSHPPKTPSLHSG